MPISYWIDEAAGFVRIDARSKLDAGEDQATLRRLIADPGFRAGMPILVDRRDGERSNADYIWSIASAFRAIGAKNVLGGVAIVSTHLVTLGFANMFMMLANENSSRVRVFQDYEEAKRWCAEWVRSDRGPDAVAAAGG